MEGSVTYLLVSSKARQVSLRLGRMEVEENSSETPYVAIFKTYFLPMLGLITLA